MVCLKKRLQLTTNLGLPGHLHAHSQYVSDSIAELVARFLQMLRGADRGHYLRAGVRQTCSCRVKFSLQLPKGLVCHWETAAVQCCGDCMDVIDSCVHCSLTRQHAYAIVHCL